MPTVLPPPVKLKLPAPVAIVIAPDDPPMVVAAVPDALRLIVPTAVRAVKVAIPGVVPPIVGGAAKTAGRLAGTKAVFDETKPATA